MALRKAENIRQSLFILILFSFYKAIYMGSDRKM